MMNKKSVHTHIFFICASLLIVLFTSCRTSNSTILASNRDIKAFPTGYRDLYKAISVRDANKILSFTHSQNLLVREQAWRALHTTKINEGKLFDAVTENNGYLAWFALSGHQLSKKHLRELGKRWLNLTDERAGISLVLGQQGDKKSLKLLLENMDQAQNHKDEFSTAMAIGRLMIKYGITAMDVESVARAALKADNSSIQQAWLYGFYRSNKDLINDAVAQELINGFKDNQDSWPRLSRQMIINILAKDHVAQLWKILTPDSLAKMDVNMTVEVARALKFYSFNEETTPFYIKLLDYPNARVVDETLKTLMTLKWSDSLMVDHLERLMESNKESNPRIYLDAMAIISRFQPGVVQRNKDVLQNFIKNRPYVSEDAMLLLKKTMKPAAYIKYLMLQVLNSDIRVATSAVELLNEQWKQIPDRDKTTWMKPFHDVVIQVLKRNDRGLTATVAPMLTDSLLFSQRDLTTLKQTLSHFTFPGDIEAYQSVAPALLKRMGERGREILDSLVTMQYGPFNSYVRQLGMKDVPGASYRKFPLLQPNWSRLNKIGMTPTWVLETQKGNITIKMDALRCPATVSAIDSLTRMHKYDGVPFHRVVDNFVIQGGDYERKDGYGGADFVLPTEPGEKAFIRGAVGIASAGNDTEGPQYFIMHQWAPHLNGHYTLFGQVLNGMSVVDNIVQGDKVSKAVIGKQNTE
jgi:cyclophilin family peptidyl-prolyl cis-trans isomerase